MQGKKELLFIVLEEKKREAREQQRMAEAEKVGAKETYCRSESDLLLYTLNVLSLSQEKAKKDAALRKALPGLYREVARETGEYTDNIGNTTTAVPRRLGGATPLAPLRPDSNGGGGGGGASSSSSNAHAGSVSAQVARMKTVLRMCFLSHLT
jgi:hypothetical protein